MRYWADVSMHSRWETFHTQPGIASKLLAFVDDFALPRSIFAYTGGSILSDVNSSDIFNAARAGKSQRLKQER